MKCLRREGSQVQEMIPKEVLRNSDFFHHLSNSFFFLEKCVRLECVCVRMYTRKTGIPEILEIF